MAVTVARPRLNWRERIYFPAILSGLVITLSHFKRMLLGRTKVTMQYPEERNDANMIITTIFVLLMMADYAPSVRALVGGATSESGLGEFFTLPIFTCAGLMYLVSAIDLVMIFVSLELVTISFYVLISLTRRNPITLEAGVKYLVLSAMVK